MPSRSQRRIPLKPLAGGVRTDKNPSLLDDGQSPNANNVEFSSESVRSARGSRKFGNQVAPAPALRCQPDPAYSPLYVEAAKSVPLRGYAWWPYDEATDIGGNFAASGSFPNQSFHDRRGRSFEINVTFRLPPDFRMHEFFARGEGAPNPGNAGVEGGDGYNEAFDDCTLILQKGGDRTSPMSWAIGVTNAGNWPWRTGMVSDKPRKSGYFLTFMWLDAPEWGAANVANMRYDLATFASGSSGSYCTTALRAFILDGRSDTLAYALEPGQVYSLSLSVTLDSLPSGVWAHDGRVDVRLKEQHGRLYAGSFVDSAGGGTTTNLSSWKGPTDSLRYLAKYGVRYSGRDAVHFGLGYRGAPWEAMGWIPFGHDSACMEFKGFRMADRSLNTVTDLFGSGYNLTCQHPVAGDSYVRVNAHRSLTEDTGNTLGPWARSPLGPRGVPWAGFGGNLDDTGAPATNFNTDALRGYSAVFPRSADGTMNQLRGGVFRIETYSESGVNDYRLKLTNIENTGLTWASEQPFLIQAFRWNQQPVEIQEYRLWSSSRDYSNPRVAWSLGSSVRLDDETEPELQKLQALIPFDDAGSRVCRELVRGKDAALAPFGLGISKQGRDGRSVVYLSGEGDALVYDLSENPVFVREMKALLQSNARGFAIELSCIIPEAHYGVATLDTNGPRPNDYEAAYCPDLVSWAVKGADEAGSPSQALPLLTMGHHSWWAIATASTPERKPQGFHVDVHTGLDSEAAAMTKAIVGFTRSNAGAGNWDDTAPWVGKRITLQVGIQPSPSNRAGTAGFDNQYRIYIAATPKSVLKYAQGEDPQAEFAYFTDAFIQKKDLPRLVVTIGGGWNPQLARGYTEYGMRLIVDEVRVYGATAAGELPATTGLVTADRRGKILGLNSLPQRALTREDILQPLGVGTRAAALSEASPTVTAPGGTSFFTQRPEDTLDSAREKFLVPLSDSFLLPSIDELIVELQEFYWIQSVAADGLSMTLATPYNGPSSARAGAAICNLIGYTDFDVVEDDILRMPITLGSGAAYKPGTTRSDDLVLSEALFENLAPVDGQWRVRVASPFVGGGLATVLPRWVRGLVAPRRNAISGIHGLDAVPFVSASGAIFRADDRWREDGPHEGLRRSFAFLGQGVADLEQRFPRATDALRFPNYTNAWPYFTSPSGTTWVYDAWVYLEDYAEIQTIAWLGCEFSHQLRSAGTTDDLRGIGIWLRLNGGRPEIVRQSSNNVFGLGAQPPMGRYTGIAADRVPLRRWTHVRFWLEHYTSGVLLVRTPGISINGRRSTVTVNAQDTAAQPTGGWIQGNVGGGLVGSAGDTRNALYLGVAKDTVSTLEKSQFAAVNQLAGREWRGGRLVGRMHPLLGRLAGVVVWRASSGDALVSGFPDFDPYTLDYSLREVRFRADLQEGVGHKVHDAATSVESGFAATTPGQVLSHPLLELYSEFGTRQQAPSFAAFGQRVYAANGGRVAQVTEQRGGPAGIIAPTTRPRVSVKRLPLWEPNVAPSGSSSPEQDPIAQAAVGAGQPIYHYSSHGNNYLRQGWHEDMRWSKADAVANTPFDILGVKGLWHPRSVAGVVPLWSARNSKDSGGLFIECVDGKARVGWYDTTLKRQVSVDTGAPVFRPGYWYYIHLRKAFPLQDEQEGNWMNAWASGGFRRRAAVGSVVGTWAVGDAIRNAGSTKRGIVTKVTAGFIEYIRWQGDADFTVAEAVQNGTGATASVTVAPFQVTGDMLVIRELAKTATLKDTALWSMKATVRCCISLTSEMPRTPNTTAIGQVTPRGILYDGAASGVVTVDTTLNNVTPFHADMVGMQWQFASTAANAPEKVYRIRTFTNNQSIIVEDEYGNLPNLSAIANRQGGVFAGVELVKSEGFDDSAAPDQGSYATEFMGSALAADPANGIARHSGKFASFGWGVVSSNISATAFYSGFNLFETATPTDLIELGTDAFAFAIYSSSGRPGELHFDTGKQFTVVDGQVYAGATPASTQPNAALEVAMSAEASTNAEALRWGFLTERELTWGRRLVQVAFYDKDQDVLSNPGPRCIVEPGREDSGNQSAELRLTLDDLPISHQPGNIHRYVYVSDANGAELYRQAIVPDNSSSSVTVSLNDETFQYEDVLDYDNAAPPNAAVIGVSQATMFYANVEVSGVAGPDLIYFSKAFDPALVPFGQLITLVSARGSEITAMVSLTGRLVVWKRDSMHEVTLREGLAIQEEKSANVGAAGPQAVAVIDEEAFSCSVDRGLYVYAGGGPVWIGGNVHDLFEEETSPLWNVDARAIARATLAVNRKQDQLVLALKAIGEKEPRRRLSVEYDSALSGAGLGGANGFRYALYEGPNVSALGSADRPGGGSHRFLAGTAEGFLVELDRWDTQREMASADSELTHPSTVTLGSGSTTSRLVLSGVTSYLDELEGVRGLTLSWLQAGVIVRATALFSDGSSIFLDRPVAIAPAAGTVVSIGAIPLSWSSKWLDCGNSEEKKNGHYLDLVMTPQASGTAALEVFADFSSTPTQLSTDAGLVSQVTLDLTRAAHRIPLGELSAKFIQVRIRTVPPSVGVALEVTEMVLRVQDVELH